MKNIYFVVLALILSFNLTGCLTTQSEQSPSDNLNHDGSYKVPENHNFEFIGFNSNIDNPSQDRRSYYKIFIDKVEMGRTTTGLESQEKIYETRLTENRHVITIEKWVLDKKRGEYIKVNNIEQPKPSFYYFKSYKDKIVSVRLSSIIYGKAEYSVEYIKD